MKYIRNLIIFLFISILLYSCATTRIQEVPVETIRTEYITNNIIDSIYIRDSIDRWQKGDTIFIYKEKIQYKLKYKTDTIIKIDTIPQIVSVTKEVRVNYTNWFQKVLMAIGGGFILIGAAYLIYKIKFK